MRLRLFLKQMSVLAAIAAPLSAQALLQHSIAMAGGSVAGTLAGKKLSDGLDSLLGNAAGVTTVSAKTGKPSVKSKSSSNKSSSPKTSAQTAAKANSELVPGGPFVAAEASGPTGKSSGRRRTNNRTVASILPEEPLTPVTQVASLRRNETAYALNRWAPAGRVMEAVTVAKLAAIKEGATAADLGTELGIPASRVLIPGNDGQLLQLVKYKNSAGKDLGIVYLADGKVVNVETTER